MSIIENCCSLVNSHINMINNIVLSKLGQQVSAATPLTRITIVQVLRLALFYNIHLELAKKEKRGVLQQIFGQCIN